MSDYPVFVGIRRNCLVCGEKFDGEHKYDGVCGDPECQRLYKKRIDIRREREAQLILCPLCKSKVSIYTNRLAEGWHSATVNCACGLQLIASGDTEQEAVGAVTKRWNTRA